MWLEEAREALSLRCLAASIEPKITSLGNRLGGGVEEFNRDYGKYSEISGALYSCDALESK